MRGQDVQRGRRRAVQAAAAIAVGALAVAVVAGCASRPDGLAARSDKSPQGAIQFAAARMAAAKSVHVHAVLSGSTPGTVDGSVVLAPTLQGDLTVKLDSADDAARVPNHVVYDGKTVYAALPPYLHATVKSKPKATWFGVDATDDGGKTPAFLAALKTDPAAFVKAALAEGKFAQVGSETADGVSATRFTGDVAGDAPGHVDVWLDAAGLPVELVFQSKADGKQAAQQGRAEVHFSDWGKAVTITVPPADEVLKATDEISFAISGQSFQVSSDDLNGDFSLPSGLETNAVIGGSDGPEQTVCVKLPLPSSTPPVWTPHPTSAPTPSAPATSDCLKVTLKASSGHLSVSASLTR